MARWEAFTFRVNQDERRLLAALTSHLQRSQSDVVRLIIREAARELVAGDNLVKHSTSSLELNVKEMQNAR